MKVAIVGASGFVGSSLVERLKARSNIEILPCIHSSGNAGRVARLGIPLTALDLLDRHSVARTLRGCTHVVNCARGGEEVMLKGLRNLLDACRSERVSGFVHLSSVAVYGDPPAQDSTNENGRTEPARGSYGWVKLEQDRMVAAATAGGLRATVLCPPNISGVHSAYLDALVAALRGGELALLDGGRAPCNLVDVHNLVHAIELALECGPGDGVRIFVTDDDPASWRDVVDALRELTGEVALPSISREELVRLAAPRAPAPISLRRSVLHLVSSEVRQALRRDPLWARIDAAVRGGVRSLGGAVERRMRLAVEGPVPVIRRSPAPALNVRVCAQQLRDVVHRCDRARRVLGYRPLYTFRQSMAAYCRWYRASRGWDTPVGSLLRAIR